MKLENLKVHLYVSGSGGMKEKAIVSGVVLDTKQIFRLDMLKNTKISFGVYSSFGQILLGTRVFNKL